MIADNELEQSHAEWMANMITGNFDEAAKIVIFILQLASDVLYWKPHHAEKIERFLRNAKFNGFTYNEFLLVVHAILKMEGFKL